MMEVHKQEELFIMNMYINEPLQHYLDDLASAKPTPGGGSASALTGAMGAALASMVARLTQDKPGYATVHQEIEELVQRIEKLRSRFQQLMQEDIDAYGRLSACFKMPHNTDEERATRSAAIQDALLQAALVPLTTVESAGELVNYCRRIAEIGNTLVLSDVVVAATLASGAGKGASEMVRINLHSMKDAERVKELTGRLNVALEDIVEGCREVTSIVGRRQ